jgi:hypothetical protein
LRGVKVGEDLTLVGVWTIVRDSPPKKGDGRGARVLACQPDRAPAKSSESTCMALGRVTVLVMGEVLEGAASEGEPALSVAGREKYEGAR